MGAEGQAGGSLRDGSVLERINPKQGFQNTSNVSATLIECGKKKKALYGMLGLVQPFSLPHLDSKTVVKMVSPRVKREQGVGARGYRQV